MKILRIHVPECPAPGCADCDHDHACTCTAQADLAELVAAAELVRKFLFARYGESQIAHQLDVRLGDALKPFREEKPR